jgi:hypothetical protein
LTNNSPQGELTLIVFPIVSVGKPFLVAKALDMNECDARVLNKTNAINEFRGNIPITAAGSFITSSTLM